MLTFDRVSYRYAGAAGPSLLDLDLRLERGEVIGVVGPSESGKSTLCLVASGLAPRSIGGTLSGRLLIDGVDVADEPMHVMASRVGILFQNPATQLSGVAQTVFEEVAFGPANLAVRRAELLARTDAALGAFDLGELAPRDPARLSGGQQQLVAISGLLAMDPQHFVLDEPTAQLDPAGTHLVGDAIARLAARGAGILVAEQKTDLLARIAHRVIVLDRGEIVLEGRAGDVLADPHLEDLGVAPPAAVRLRREAEEAGVGGSRLDEALHA